MSFWFEPKSSPPTLRSFCLNNMNEDTRRGRGASNYTSENRNYSEEFEFHISHDDSQSKESAWAAGSLTRRIQQMISPTASSSSSLLLPPVALSTGQYLDNLLPISRPHPSFDGNLAGNPRAVDEKNVRVDNNLSKSWMKPNATDIYEASSKTLTNYWQHVQFFHPRPIETQDQNLALLKQANETGLVGFENHPTIHRMHDSMQTSEKENSSTRRLPQPFSSTHPSMINDPKAIQSCSYRINTQNNKDLNPTSSSLLLPHHPFEISNGLKLVAKKQKSTGSHYTQGLISRNGQITIPRVHQNSSLDRSWDQVHLNVVAYQSSTEQVYEQQQQQRQKLPTKKRDATKKRPLPDSDDMISPYVTEQVKINHNDNHTASKPHKNRSNTANEKYALPVIPTKVKASKKADTEKQRINHQPKEGTRKSINTGSKFNQHMIPRIQWQTFQILEEMYKLNNAGTNMDCLRRFLQMVQDRGIVAYTPIFYDKYCTTPFLPMNKRYCTDKGPQCTMWNCTCDQQIRAMQSSKPVAGVLFCLPRLSTSSENQDFLSNFFLPLGPTSEMDDDPDNIDQGYERMINWPLLPIRCETSIKQRWDAFRSILMNKFVTCVTYNAVMGLMPYHYHCMNDKVNPSDDTVIDWNIPKIWDLRLASWLLSPHADESELELDRKMLGFPHLCDSNIPPLPLDASDHLHGFVIAIKQLCFLNKVYPLINNILSQNGLQASFEEIESPLLSILSAMECHGIGFRKELFAEIQDHVEKKLNQLSDEARTFAKDDNFLLSSPQQISHLLFDVMKIPEPQGIAASKGHPSNNTNPNRHRSTSEVALKQIQAEALARLGSSLPIVDVILEFRTLNKMLTSFIRPFPLLCCSIMNETRVLSSNRRSKKDKKIVTVPRIHPMWIQTAVRTGRLSCRKPNMQQIPTGSVLELYPRSAFIPTSEELCLFSFDYSQNEVRILAHMSGDKALIDLFQSPESVDIYKLMSSAITGKSVDDVDDQERAIAKQVTLAILYGMGINQVAAKLGVDRSAAYSFFNSFYSRFRGVKKWMEETKKNALRNKFVLTLSGRKRFLDDIDSEDDDKRAQAERQAVNTVIQGSAADIIKLAMLKIAARLSDWSKESLNGGCSGKTPRILLQIHDELLFEIGANESDANRLKSVVLRCSDECKEEFRLNVPLKLMCNVGTSWATMQEF